MAHYQRCFVMLFRQVSMEVDEIPTKYVVERCVHDNGLSIQNLIQRFAWTPPRRFHLPILKCWEKLMCGCG